MNRTYLLLGGNVGNRFANLEVATEEIEKYVGKILKKSAFYETHPWGNENQAKFLNRVIFAETLISPETLLSEVLKIENFLGRVRGEKKWEKRIIDIDVLFYLKEATGESGNSAKWNNIIFKMSDLEIPHPLLHLRKFTLVPLNEIAPGLFHPLIKKTVSELLKDCKDVLKVEKVLEEKISH